MHRKPHRENKKQVIDAVLMMCSSYNWCAGCDELVPFCYKEDTGKTCTGIYEIPVILG